MAFREIRFPTDLSLGSAGGPLFSTHIVAVRDGTEQRNQCWREGLAVYEVGLVARDATATNVLRRFFRSVALGRRHGFRFHDPLPGEDTGYHEALGVGDGVVTTFQLAKYYTLGGYTHARTITKPVAGSVRVWLNSVETTAFTVNTTTGVVTMTSPPGGGVVLTAWYNFDVPVRFNTDYLDIQYIEPGLYSWPSIKLVETKELV